MGFHHGTMGLTNQQSAVINEVAGQLNKASEMHKGQAEKLRSLGETKQAPPGYHYMPDGSLMANSEHNLGYANFGNSVSPRAVGIALTGAVVGNTLIPSLGTKWVDAIDLGFLITGFAHSQVDLRCQRNPSRRCDKTCCRWSTHGLGLFYMKVRRLQIGVLMPRNAFTVQGYSSLLCFTCFVVFFLEVLRSNPSRKSDHEQYRLDRFPFQDVGIEPIPHIVCIGAMFHFETIA